MKCLFEDQTVCCKANCFQIVKVKNIIIHIERGIIAAWILLGLKEKMRFLIPHWLMGHHSSPSFGTNV